MIDSAERVVWGACPLTSQLEELGEHRKSPCEVEPPAARSIFYSTMKRILECKSVWNRQLSEFCMQIIGGGWRLCEPQHIGGWSPSGLTVGAYGCFMVMLTALQSQPVEQKPDDY